MYELVQVGAHSYYINCPAKIGVWVEENRAWLVDSGSDKDAGRRVRKILDENGWQLEAIVNTHSHADHIGGNAYLQKQTGCQIYAKGIEAAITRAPILEPALLYGGCPPEALRHKFLMAQPSDVQELDNAPLPKGFEVLPLPGHCFEQVGYRTPDDVLFLADCVSSEATLAKYGVTYLYNVEAHLQTLEEICTLEAALFVPAHAEPCKNICPLAQINRDATLEVGEVLARLCETPIAFDHLLQKVFAHWQLAMTPQQHALVGSTVKSYLTWLCATGRLATEIQDNLLLWKAL